MKITPIAAGQNAQFNQNAGVEGGKSVDLKNIKMKTNHSVMRDLPQQSQAETDKNATFHNDDSVAEDKKPLSPQFAALAKKQRALDVREKALADRETALSEKEKTLVDQPKTGLDVERLKADPFGVLQEHGLSFDQLTEMLMSGKGKVDPEILALKQQLKTMEEKLTKSFDERDQGQVEQVRKEIRSDIERLVATGDDFEMIRATKSHKDVDDLIFRIWEEKGEVLDTREACELIEKELLEESLKLAKLKKIQGHFQPQNAGTLEQKGPAKTLTNNDNARPILGRRERALAAANGTLKR